MSEPKILDGKSLAKSLEQSLIPRVEAIIEKSLGRIPVLATILVGDDPASATYVRMKGNACKRVGMESRKLELPETTTTEQLLHEIEKLNGDPDVHGILLQHPVPDHVHERTCFDAIALEKDVDGVTSLGFGRMVMGEFAYGSATPSGIMRILDHYEIDVKGMRAVVIGRSPILGKPMAMMLLNRHATVTICHSRTKDLPEVVREGDIVVGAVGKPKFIQADWIKPGAIIVDAGYHPGGIGDVDLENAATKSAAFTPVPGGVGPMTIASLVTQTVEAAERQLGLD